MDFFSKFSQYETKDLLKITLRPDNYQPTAVRIAFDILATREVSDDERNSAQCELVEEEALSAKTSKGLSEVRVKSGDFIRYLFQPSEKFEVKRWVYLLSIALGVQYIWQSVYSIEYLVFFFKCESCNLTMAEALYAFPLIFTPVLLILFLGRKKLGWSLAAFNSLAVVIIATSLALLQSGSSIPAISVSDVIELILHLCLLRFLMKDDITSYFKVQKRQKSNTIKISILISAGLVALILIGGDF
jgi:hypothetical protein